MGAFCTIKIEHDMIVIVESREAAYATVEKYKKYKQ